MGAGGGGACECHRCSRREELSDTVGAEVTALVTREGFVKWACLRAFVIPGFVRRRGFSESVKKIFLGATNDAFNFNNEGPVPTIYYFLWL